jgi:hypothetical protein
MYPRQHMDEPPTVKPVGTTSGIPTRADPRRVEWDEIVATAYRIALTLSVGVAVVGALNELATRGSFGWPNLLQIVLIAAGAITFRHWQTWARPVAIVAGGAAVLVWLSVLPVASDEAILVPAFMAASCAAGAVWVSGWRLALTAEREATSGPQGWIEEDGRRV